MAGELLSNCKYDRVSITGLNTIGVCKVACGCAAILLQAIEKVEASTGMKLLHKYKLLQVQYKGVDAETRCAVTSPQHAVDIITV